MPKPIQFMQATWQDIVGSRHHHLAAIMRGQTEEADQIREEMHGLLDAYLDHQTEAAVAAELKANG